MFAFFYKYKNISFLICFCIISIILSWLYISPDYESDQSGLSEVRSNPVKNALSFLLVPNQFLEQIISKITDKIFDMGNFIWLLFQKPKEYEEFESLRNSVQSLSYQLDEEQEKNERLEKLWEFSTALTKIKPTFRLMPAKVIAIEPTDWFRYITIDKGRNHGISVDMAVITQVMYPNPKSVVTTKNVTGAVVGRIKSVQAYSSRIQLITDSMSAVAVSIGPLKDLAILKGEPESEICVINEVPSTTNDVLKVADPVLVDERSSVFPSGLLIGWISFIGKETQFCHIEVKPAFRFSRLRDVIVVLNSEY